MTKKPYPKDAWHPRYWPSWAGIGFLFLAAWLPWPVKIGLGRCLGWIAYQFFTGRRHITHTNLKLCFPEKSPEEIHQLVKQTFLANGIGIFETATGLVRDPSFMRDQVIWKGQEHLDAALARGKGAIILGLHFSSLDLGGALHSLRYQVDVVYRPQKNRLMDTFIYRGRQKHFVDLVDRNHLKHLIRTLRQGRGIWYSPDQDFGRKVSVFAPFFGVNAATISMTSRIARISGAPVLPLRIHRVSNKPVYEIEYLPPLDPFPTDDEVADATRINRVIEQLIRQHPEQYLWMHKRFKTRPPGDPGIY